MDVIDAAWIKQHLTNRHGELVELARATGLAADKITKILKGERRISATEAAAIYRFLSPNTRPGMSEPANAFTPAQAATTPVDALLARHLAPQVRRPMAYQIARPITSLLLDAGDTVIIDTDSTATDAGLVVVNILAINQTNAATQLRRAWQGMLIATDPDDPEPVIRADDTGRCGVIGQITASYRTPKG